MKRYFVLLLTLFSTILVSQTYDASIYKNQIKLSPVRLFTLIRGIQMSFERQLTDRFSVQLTANYITDPFSYHYSDLTDLKGFLVGTESKYFINQHKIFANYLSADFTFLKASCNIVQEFTYKPDNDSLPDGYTDTITIHRKTYTFSIKKGIQFFFKQFVLDLNIGIGLRYRDVSHGNKLREDGIWWRRLEPSIKDEFFINGQYFTFNIPLGFKIGYRF